MDKLQVLMEHGQRADFSIWFSRGVTRTTGNGRWTTRLISDSGEYARRLGVSAELDCMFGW